MDGTRVTLFTTCLVDTLRPDLIETSVALVEADGTQRCTPAKGATCCGQPAWNAGFADDARRVARRTLRSLSRTEGPIVVPSGSCATMISHGWPELFAETRQEGEAKAVARRVTELAAHLAGGDDEPGETPVSINTGPIDTAPSAGTSDAAATVTVHDSCHLLRELGVKEAPRQVLREAGVAIVETSSSERCCGFGGTFSVKMPGVSAAMADEKLDDFVASGADRVVGCDLSCLMHLEGRAKQRGLDLSFEHLATTVAEAEATT